MHCEIISQYADEECGILAQEKVPTKSTDNVMYFNHSSYIFEILKLDSVEPAAYGEVGRIVITVTIMPFRLSVMIAAIPAS